MHVCRLPFLPSLRVVSRRQTFHRVMQTSFDRLSVDGNCRDYRKNRLTPISSLRVFLDKRKLSTVLRTDTIKCDYIKIKDNTNVSKIEIKK